MFRNILFAGVGMLLCTGASAQITVETLSPDELQIRQWNAFVDKLYVLHQSQIAGQEVTEESRIGGYHRQPEFFEEVKFSDKASGRLLSKVQWELDSDPGLLQWISSLWSDPHAPRSRDTVHSIEVYVYDDQGRVVRDYSATYLPDFRNAPIQTLVALHGYSDGLHAFRNFDASGVLIFEVCRGELNGEKVDIGMDEDSINAARRSADSIMHTEAYKACFDTVPVNSGTYHTTPG